MIELKEQELIRPDQNNNINLVFILFFVFIPLSFLPFSLNILYDNYMCQGLPFNLNNLNDTILNDCPGRARLAMEFLLLTISCINLIILVFCILFMKKYVRKNLFVLIFFAANIINAIAY